MRPRSSPPKDAYERFKKAHQGSEPGQPANFPAWLSGVRQRRAAAQQAVTALEASLHLLLAQRAYAGVMVPSQGSGANGGPIALASACDRLAESLLTQSSHPAGRNRGETFSPVVDALRVVASELRSRPPEAQEEPIPPRDLSRCLHQLASQVADRDAASVTPLDVARFMLALAGPAEGVDVYALDGIGLLYATRTILPPETVRLVGDEVGQTPSQAWPSLLSDMTMRDLQADFNPGRFCSRACSEIEWGLGFAEGATNPDPTRRLLLINAAKLKVPFDTRPNEGSLGTPNLSKIIKSPHSKLAILVSNQALTAGRGMAQERWQLLKAAGLRRVVQLPIGSVGPRHHEHSVLLLDRQWREDTVEFVEIRQGLHTKPAMRGFGQPRRGDELAFIASQCDADGLPGDVERAVASATDLAEVRRAKTKGPKASTSRLMSFAASRALKVDPFASLKGRVELRPLGAFMDVFRSHHIKRTNDDEMDSYREVGVPQVDRIGTITLGDAVQCSKASLQARSDQILQQDDLIMCFRGARESIGLVGRYRTPGAERAVPNQSFVILRLRAPSDGFIPPPVELVFWWLRTPRVKKYLRQRTVAPDVPRLAPKDIMAIPVPVGPDALIAKRAQVLEEFENIVEQLEALRHRLDSLEGSDWTFD